MTYKMTFMYALKSDLFTVAWCLVDVDYVFVLRLLVVRENGYHVNMDCGIVFNRH